MHMQPEPGCESALSAQPDLHCQHNGNMHGFCVPSSACNWPVLV